MSGIQLLVGLGNPGPQYEATRHNAGFWWIDQLGAVRGCKLSAEAKFSGLVGRFRHAGNEVWLLKPATFMNASGRSVAALARFYKIDPASIVVIHDELDLPPGTVKLKKGGGNGGHNGLKDIAAQLGTNDFWRLRLGIGHPGDRSAVVSYVLNAPTAEEMHEIAHAMDNSMAVVDLMLGHEFEAAMLKLHTKK